MKFKLLVHAPEKVPGEMFWVLTLIVISAFRLVWVTDLPIIVSSAPHDDYLYVQRAYCLLTGGSFCNYSQTIFEKMPGLSLWIAAMRQLSIPYLLSIHGMLFASTLYLIVALKRAGVPRTVLTVIYAFIVFHQFTYSHAWFRVMREPLILSLHLLIFGAMIHLFYSVIDGRPTLRHSLLMSFSLVFSVLTREEDKVLYLTFFFFIASWLAFFFSHRSVTPWIRPMATIVLPFLILSAGASTLLRAFVKARYGMPIVYEMSEGEYPKLIAALRSIVVKNQHPQVMISQEAISKAVKASPRLLRVFEKIDPPHPKSESCVNLGICDEWTNGWMVFWIKWAAFDAGVTPDMLSAQQFYRQAHMEIDQACSLGRLQCERKGNGVVPPFQWRYRWDFWNELKSAVWRTFTLGHSQWRRPELFEERLVFGDFFQATTMTHYFRNREIQHLEHAPDYANARLAKLRPKLAKWYVHYAPRIALIGFVSFLVLLFLNSRSVLFSPVGLVSVVFLLSSFVRLLAIAHVSTFMKLLEDRIFASTHLLWCAMGLYWTWQLVSTLAAKKPANALFRLPIWKKSSEP